MENEDAPDQVNGGHPLQDAPRNMTTPRPTPRTDEVCKTTDWLSGELVVSQEFACQLERELEDAIQLNRELLDKLKRMHDERDAMRQAIKEFDELARWLAANSTGLHYRTVNAIVARCRPFLAECGQSADKPAEIQAMLEAIKEAHRFIRNIVYNHECGYDIDANGTVVLTKLTPFIQ